MYSRPVLLTISRISLALAASVAGADQWPQFRGPDHNGSIAEAVPMEWDTEQGVAWRVPLEGEGWSAPIVWDDHLFLTAAVMTRPPARRADEEAEPARPTRRRGRGYRQNMETAEFRWEVQCFDTVSGDLRWRQVTREGHPPQNRHLQNTYASETPVTDGARVYAYFGMNGLYCFDMDGSLLWEKDLGNYTMRNGWGTSSSPVLHDGMLYLQIDSQEQSFVVALDAASGEEVWRVDRDEPSQYSSPVIWKNSQRTELVTSARRACSYDPRTGKLLWQLDLKGGRSSATPLPAGDRIYVGSEIRNRGGDDDGGGYLFAVNAGAEGIVSAEDDRFVAWAVPRSGIQMASPVLCAGHLYLFERRRGVLHCIDAESGEMVYENRVTGARAFWASPWASRDKVFCVADSGTTYVIQAGPEYRVLRKNPLDEQVWSSPAVAKGKLYIRTTESLYCIGR